jgi:hypothetical protein
MPDWVNSIFARQYGKESISVLDWLERRNRRNKRGLFERRGTKNRRRCNNKKVIAIARQDDDSTRENGTDRSIEEKTVPVAKYGETTIHDGGN